MASLVRGSYHLYQGFGGATANFVLGLFFGRIFQRRGRVMPMLVAHFLIDAVAFVGYVELKPPRQLAALNPLPAHRSVTGCGRPPCPITTGR